MATDQDIVDATIDLFNEHGVARVTVRDVAAKLKMSPGNLTYHFANKDLLVKATIEKLIDAMDRASGAAFTEPTLTSYRNLLGVIWDLQVEFRFFYVDSADVLRTYTQVRALYQSAVGRRIEQTKKFFKALINAKQMRPLDASSLTSLVLRQWMVLAFWQTRLIVLAETPSKAKFVNEVIGVLRPYLTARGLQSVKAAA